MLAATDKAGLFLVGLQKTAEIRGLPSRETWDKTADTDAMLSPSSLKHKSS